MYALIYLPDTLSVCLSLYLLGNGLQTISLPAQLFPYLLNYFFPSTTNPKVNETCHPEFQTFEAGSVTSALTTEMFISIVQRAEVHHG